MIIRTPEERTDIIEAGRRLGVVLETLAGSVRPGVTTKALNEQAESLILAGGDGLSFKGYSPEGARYPYPSALCISVNDEVVHGIPSDRVLQEGDIVTLDLGLTHHGLIVDSALTVPVGKTDQRSYELMDTTQAALVAGIAAARPGAHVGDISHAIEETFKGSGISVVKILGGHGVGRHVHEEPFIANIGHPGTGPEIVSGMVLALEPIANAGKPQVELLEDDYTFATRDGSKSAHFEHTILVEDAGTLVLTRRPSEDAS